jgi:hypothetical protein
VAKTTDRQALQNARTREKADRRWELDGVRHLMSEPVGRALVQRLLEKTGVDRPIPFQPNAMVLAHDVGLQALGHWMLAEVRAACPELELAMRREYVAREQRSELEDEASNDNPE